MKATLKPLHILQERYILCEYLSPYITMVYQDAHAQHSALLAMNIAQMATFWDTSIVRHPRLLDLLSV